MVSCNFDEVLIICSFSMLAKLKNPFRELYLGELYPDDHLEPIFSNIFLLTYFGGNGNIYMDESDGSFGKHIRGPLGVLFSILNGFFCWPERYPVLFQEAFSRKGGYRYGRRTGEMV